MHLILTYAAETSGITCPSACEACRFNVSGRWLSASSKQKKREPENQLPRWILLWFSLERVAQVEANAARSLVEERLAVPWALNHRRNRAAVPVEPRLRVVPVLDGVVRRR